MEGTESLGCGAGLGTGCLRSPLQAGKLLCWLLPPLSLHLCNGVCLLPCVRQCCGPPGYFE